MRSRPAPRRSGRASTVALATTALVVVAVVAIIAVDVATGAGSSAGSSAVTATPMAPAPASLVSEVEDVPPSVQDAVGGWSAVGVPDPSYLAAPTMLKHPTALHVAPGTEPQVLYVGGEFCPFCAAARWALVLAMSRFGTVSGLAQAASSPWDQFPRTPTFSFIHARYHSRYVTFVPVEHYGQDVDGAGTHTVLQPLSAAERSAWSRYGTVSGVAGVPFIDVAGRVVVAGAPIEPALLHGMRPAAVAAAMHRPASPVARAVVGTADSLVAGVCAADGERPTTVCQNPGVRVAASAMGIRQPA